MVEQLQPGLYRITVDLPGNPLKSVNDYLLCGSERNLLVDTAFNRPDCHTALMEGLAEVGAAPQETDLFLTHFHADHSGLAGRLAGPGTAVYLGQGDHALMTRGSSGQYWAPILAQSLSEGYPAEELARTQKANPARLYVADRVPPLTPVRDGQVLEYGGRRLCCVHTPGHTPGHTCLYDEANGLLLAGDHLLYDITPNITNWLELEDALGSYLDSLSKIEALGVKTALPGHRGIAGTVGERIAQLRRHHAARLDDAQAIVNRAPGVTAYEAAAQMRWNIRAKSWADFPPGQRWFAVGESLAHLHHLAKLGRVQRTLTAGLWRYSPA